MFSKRRVKACFLGKIKISTICPENGKGSRGVIGCGKGVMYLSHGGVQLRLAYSWARPAILVAGKGRGECLYFFCFFTFIPVPL